MTQGYNLQLKISRNAQPHANDTYNFSFNEKVFSIIFKTIKLMTMVLQL